MLDALKGRAKNGALVIAILHDLNLAALFADRVIVLAHGRIDCDGHPEVTITDNMLNRVFELETTVSKPPELGTTFVLPQTMKPMERFSIRT